MENDGLPLIFTEAITWFQDNEDRSTNPLSIDYNKDRYI